MYWIIIIALIILAFIFLRMSHQRHRMVLIILILVFLFLYITGSRISKQYDVSWKSVAGIEKGVKIYFSWLGGAFGNIKTITSNVIKMDWNFKNKTQEDVRVIEQKTNQTK